jgi:hypothetical protein
VRSILTLSAPSSSELSDSPPLVGGGAAYDPSTDTWRKLPAAPIAPRRSHVAVWTGSEMVIWGGADTLGRALDDGAAYDVGSNSWRRLPQGPLQARENMGAVWTGHDVLIWGGHQDTSELEEGDVLNGFNGGAAYNPSANRWSKLPHSPLHEFTLLSSLPCSFFVPRTSAIPGNTTSHGCDSFRVCLRTFEKTAEEPALLEPDLGEHAHSLGRGRPWAQAERDGFGGV